MKTSTITLSYGCDFKVGDKLQLDGVPCESSWRLYVVTATTETTASLALESRPEAVWRILRGIPARLRQRLRRFR